LYIIRVVHLKDGEKEMRQELGSQTKPSARRSAFETMMDVLKVTSEGPVKPTHIMYRSNTSWVILQKNLESLISLGFVGQKGEGSRTEYTVTTKGTEVLRDYASLLGRTTVVQTAYGEAPW
jgi:predicted transcriptional regulator